ncbi:CD5 antigen-like, partial [Stylophora pistillata]|uniref:CD5 antigen-like n=1 Tax=Stylophora pistillata TaxID=50429 RepID=UPI000C04EB24
MEIRECSSHTKCTAYRIRLSHIPSYAAKLKLEVSDGKKWTSVCHSVGIADNLCQIQGFESAENEKNCNMIQTHSYGNTTCGVLKSIISINCSDTHEVTTVCKVNVSLEGIHSGKVKFLHRGILKPLSGIRWNMIAAQLVCRQIGFKRAVAPFSTNISRPNVSKECVDHIDCSGPETSLSYCKFNFTTNYKCNPDAEASLTCDPERDLEFKFRRVNIMQFGETIQFECNLNDSYGDPQWYSFNGQIVGSEKNLRLQNLTTTQAGVYFCKNSQEYGAVVVYVAAKSTMKQMTIPEKKYTTLTCNVSGVPQPMVLPLWRLNGQLLRKATVTINNGLNITDEVR